MTQTNASGGYLFQGLPPDRYTVVVLTSDGAIPSGWGPTTFQPVPVNLGPGESFLTADFGFGPYAAIGDTVFFDENGSGHRDQGTDNEYGIPNITVWLWRDANANGSIDAGDTRIYTTTTDANGFYFFRELTAGDYLVELDTSDPDLPGDWQLTTPNPRVVTGLAAGQFYPDADFGLRGSSTIGDFVWRDLDGDGVQDGGAETGIPNITVELWADSNGNGLLDTGSDRYLGAFPTDATGAYSFTYVFTGAYLVRALETDPDLPSGYNPTTANPLHVVISAPGTSYLAADFGFGAFGSIGDFVWHDLNRNGAAEAGEPGLSNVTVKLYAGACPPSGGPLQMTTTDVGGVYGFYGLAAGAYCVDVDDPSALAGYTLTTANDPLTVNLASGQAYDAADFGYGYQADLGIAKTDAPDPLAPGQLLTYTLTVANAGPAAASSVMVTDTLPLSVTLALAAASQGACTGTATITCTLGTLAAGGQATVTLQVTVSEAARGTLLNTATVGSATYDPNASNNTASASTTLVVARLGDLAWQDSNGDGIYDPGSEFGVPNVPLRVQGLTINGTRTDITVTTSITGHYVVEGLVPGVYTVTAPSSVLGHVLTSPSPLTTTLTVTRTEDLTLDFAYRAPTGVNVLAFAAAYDPVVSAVRVQWTALVDAHAQGFVLYRAAAAEGPYKQIVAQAILATAGMADYAHVDSVDVTPRVRYWYKLQEVRGGAWFGPVASAPFYRVRVFAPLIGR
jgi:uncharacterized repeat protein (TIGR01451 family)